jgi:hypothetical protein
MMGEYAKLVESVINDGDDGKKQAIIAQIEAEREKGGLGYVPGLTAMKRREGSISTIATLIEKKGLIPEGSRILHAGAGRLNNPDREYLDSKGDTYHYDPAQPTSNNRSLLSKSDFDVVVSPFVLNVLAEEDRVHPMNDMVKSLHPAGLAIVGVRGVSDINSETKPHWSEWSDGFLVPKSGKHTFQKGFSPTELKEYLLGYFGEVDIVRNSNKTPVAVARKPRIR